MPESLSQLEEMNSFSMDSPTNNLSVSYELVKNTEHPGCGDQLSRSERSMSVESLNTLLSKLPEISIPATLCNPLPLQCIAANALPDNVRAEIDGVIAQYTDTNATTASPSNDSEDSYAQSTTSLTEQEEETEDNVDSLTAALHRALGIEEAANTAVVNKPAVSVAPVCKKTIQREAEDEISTGFGLKLCGGVRCTNCGSLHAIVTGMSASLYEVDDIQEGVCVVEWAGLTLDGCTYEEAQRIVNSVDPDVDEIKISVNKCSENVLTSQGDSNWLPSFAAVRLNKRRNAIFETKKNKSKSENCSVPPSPRSSYGLSRSRDQLDLTAFSDNHSLSRSPSPSESTRSLVSRTEEGSQSAVVQSAAMASALESLSFDNLDSIVNTQPKGMIQLCLEYNKGYEELNISLLQVKGYSSKEPGDSCDVFINTYLVPDRREQGVRSVMISQTRKDGTEPQSSSYLLATDEVPCTALRVVLWDARKPKHIEFRGEVFLGLSDQQFVSLASEPTWYTLCPEDPNLSKLPPPVYSRAKNGVDYLFQKLKQKAHSLTSSKPLVKLSNSLSSELRSVSMLSLHGRTVEKRTMTLARKKQRQEPIKTYSGSFMPPLENNAIETEEAQLKDSCKQKKLSLILNVLKESSVDSESHEHATNNATDDGTQTEQLNRTLRHSKSETFSTEKQRRKRSDVRENKNAFFEELEKIMDQENFGLQSIFEKKNSQSLSSQTEQVHYKLVDSCHSEDELERSTKSSPSRSLKANDFSSYPAEVSLHKISVEDVDRKEEAKKKCRTLPNEHSSQQAAPVYLPTRGASEKIPNKPPKTYRSKSVGDIEQLGSEEELFIVRSHHTTNTAHVDSSYSENLEIVEPVDFEEVDGVSSLDFGNRQENNVDNLRGTSVPVAVSDDRDAGKKLLKSKWKSLEDILAPKPKKLKEKKTKLTRTASPLGGETRLQTFFRRSSSISSDNGTTASPCNVKLDIQFNDLNPAHPVLLVKLLDIVLPSSKLLSSELLLKCYVNHTSTGVCILKDKTPVCLKNNPSSAPLGILQFGTDIANLSLQIQILGGSKLFSRKMIGQVSVALAALSLSNNRAHSQWYTLSKPEL